MADHDGGYKLLFSHPRMVEELLRGFVPEAWVDGLDFSTLEPCRASVVGDDLQQRHIDLVWRLRWRGSAENWLYAYLMLEFQSTPDAFMAVRILGYVALLLGALIREGTVDIESGLPVVLPLVLYNGRRPWNAPLDLASLFRAVPSGVERYLPQLRYLLIDENRLSAEQLAVADSRVATLFRLETAALADLPRLTAELAARLPRGEEPELRRAFAGWLYRLLRRHLPGATIPSEVEDLEEIAMLGETLQEWWDSAVEEGEKKGLREGEEKGRREGMRDLLLRLLVQRFGEVPLKIRRKVTALRTVEELERLLDRALAASTLEELRFG